MGLNEQKGNMYEFVTHTWNTIKGECPHCCSYCYMKRWGKQAAVRFDEKELRTDLGSGNFIFVGSSCDMFADGVNPEWMKKTLDHCREFERNQYLFQSKNPEGILIAAELKLVPKNSIVCTTIESDISYPDIYGKSPDPLRRVAAMSLLSDDFRRFVTIEPILDFNTTELVRMIKEIAPEQVNIGADSGGNNLPEPSEEKILALVEELKKFTHIENKRNLGRILRAHDARESEMVANVK